MIRTLVRSLAILALMLAVAYMPRTRVCAGGGSAAHEEESLPRDVLADLLLDGARHMPSHTSGLRKKKLEAYQVLAAQYSDTESGQAALRRVRLLARLVDEDEAVAKQPHLPDNELSREELMEQWIFRLRNEKLTVCSLYRDAEGFYPENGPAALLMSCGHQAIPVLLKHLQDDTPVSCQVPWDTRNVFNVSQSLHCDSVGHLSKVMLMVLIGSDLGRKIEYSDYDATFEKRAQSWWEQFQHNGETLMLCRGLLAGDDTILIQARRLAQRYPDSAEEPLRRALDRARDPELRLELLKMLVALLDRNEQQHRKSATTRKIGDITADPAASLLRCEVRVPCVKTWKFAAEELRRRHQPLGVLAVLSGDSKLSNQWDLIRCLATSNNPTAIRLLAGWMRAEQIDSSLQDRLVMVIGDERLEDGERLKPEVCSVMDDILITALDRRAAFLLGGPNGKTYSWTMHGRAAGYLAKLHFPNDCFNFDNSQPEERDRQIDKLKEKLRYKLQEQKS
jgi:hypothetical protein